MQIDKTAAGLFSLQAAAQGKSGNLTITKQSDSATASNSSAASSDAAPESTATKNFLDYMKKSVGQRMRDAWLASHHLTEEQLKSMSSTERDAIEKQMAADIKEEMKQKSVKTTPTQGLVTTLAQSM